MITAWMLHAILVGTLLGATGRGVEKFLRSHGVPSRWVWAAVLLPACSGGDDAGPHPDEDSRSGEPAVWTVSHAADLVIGQAEGEEPYLFSRIDAAVLLPDGGVAVADRGGEGVRVFGPHGIFRREIGRRGEGPGEFGSAALLQLAVVPPDTLEVYDSRLYRMSRFLLTGRLLSTIQLQAEDGRPEVYLGTFSTGEVGFAWIKMGPRNWSRLSPDTMQLARFDESGRMTTSLGTETGIVRSSSGVYAFSPHLYAALIGDSVFLTNGVDPEIEVRDYEGDPVRVIPVPIPATEFATALDALKEEIQARGNQTEMGWFENQPGEGAVPRISTFLVDDRTRLWAKTYEPRADNHILLHGRLQGGRWWVLQPDGSVLATVQIPDELVLLDVRGNLLLGKTRDDLGVERIQVHLLDRDRDPTLH